MEPEVIARLQECERQQVRLRRAAYVLGALLAVSLLTHWGGKVQADTQIVPQLRARELVIVDSKGVERVRVGGDLPDAVINGKRVPRGEQAAGVMLYDGTGQERGGYVTWEPSGNAGLTLDTRQNQVVLLVAGPSDASALALRHGRDLIEMRSDPDGTRLTGVRDGSVVFQNPPIAALTAETCNAYRGARSRASADQVMRSCRARFTDDLCHACLDQK